MKKNNQRNSTNKNSWLNFLDTLTSIIIIPILVLSVVCSVIMINAKRSNNVPNIFGYSLVTILSESMTNSGFEIDDAVMVKKSEAEELQVGDIIAYYKYIEITSANLSDIARAEKNTALAETTHASNGENFSKVSSWKLYLSKLFSNLTYTSTEASEKAIRANSSIIFHQIVDIVDYDGYKWFKTWGTSNLDARGDPVYDSYWIREDYVIGRYTHTSGAIRSFLSFASTNSGILWMVEVPSGIHLILSTLELVEILDMMTKERHERIKNGTYIDRKEYKKMLRAKRKMLASGNIDLEAFKKMYPAYDNFEIVLSETENNKQNININGPPESNSFEDNKQNLYGTEDTLKVGESPPKEMSANKRSNSLGDEGESPPNSVGPPSEESPPSDGNIDQAYSQNNANKGEAKIAKSLYSVSTGGLYDEEDKVLEAKELSELQSSTNLKNKKAKKLKLAENEVVLSEKELSEMIDIYTWTNADFIADTNITHKGVISSPDKKNKIYLISKKTKRQFSLQKLGKILSVNTGLITTDSGIYKYILSSNGVKFEKLKINPKFTIISAKQDLFGNVFIGVTGGENTEITYSTSDGKIVSIWNRNALLTIGDNHKLYYVSMEKSYDLNKGEITDLKVMNKDGKLVSANSENIKGIIKFVDGFDKYGFLFLTPKVLCLKQGKMLYVLENNKTINLTENQWITNSAQVVEHNEKRELIKFNLNDFIERKKLNPQGEIVETEVLSIIENNNQLEITLKNGNKTNITLYH